MNLVIWMWNFIINIKNIMSESAELQLKKHITKNELKKMIENDTIWHFFIVSEMKSFNKGLIVGVVLTLVMFLVFTVINSG